MYKKTVNYEDEQWEDVTADCRIESSTVHKDFILTHKSFRVDAFNKQYRVTTIDGMHNGPAFIIVRRKQ